MGRWATLVFLGMLISQGCAPSDNPSNLYPASEGEFSVLSLTFPLLGSEPFTREAVRHWLTETPPDLCILQRLESKEQLSQIISPAELSQYHQTWGVTGPEKRTSVLLSKIKPEKVIQHEQLQYTVKGQKYNLQHTPLEAHIPLPNRKILRCIIAPLLAKRFHPAGQSEMRRNEARLLGRLIAQPPETLEPLHTLVLSSFLDHPQSDAMQKMMGSKGWDLIDAQPLDVARGAWTFFDATKESGHRFDFLFCDATFAQGRIIGKCKIPSWLNPEKLESGHRPLYAVYKLSEKEGSL